MSSRKVKSTGKYSQVFKKCFCWTSHAHATRQGGTALNSNFPLMARKRKTCVFIAFAVENAELVTQISFLQSQEKELQQQLSESNEKNHQQLVYITELETTLVDTDRILKEVSDDILRKEQEFKYCKGMVEINLERS